ncbi:MAG: GNAT family N-acetyltransferase [Lachnospiraceae bacterium]|nr:GNAT family N-acetyltransferase [Lachnospiraceae bacterium]
MAPYITYTDRLILAIELPEIADKVLEFYIKNASTFERYEPTRPEDFYTLEYHQQAMEGELSLYDMGSFVRYYIYTKDDPDIIVGALNFNVKFDTDTSFVEIGYKIDSDYRNLGIATEAVREGLRIMHDYYNINRFDMRILPNNYPSKKVAKKLGFEPVEFEPQSANVLGEQVDVMRFRWFWDKR